MLLLLPSRRPRRRLVLAVHGRAGGLRFRVWVNGAGSGRHARRSRSGCCAPCFAKGYYDRSYQTTAQLLQAPAGYNLRLISIDNQGDAGTS